MPNFYDCILSGGNPPSSEEEGMAQMGEVGTRRLKGLVKLASNQLVFAVGSQLDDVSTPPSLNRKGCRTAPPSAYLSVPLCLAETSVFKKS